MDPLHADLAQAQDRRGSVQPLVATRAVLDAAQGKIVLLDECYVLDDNLYGKQVLDTIVERVMGAPGEDIAVIMAGYKTQVLKMLRDQMISSALESAFTRQPQTTEPPPAPTALTGVYGVNAEQVRGMIDTGFVHLTAAQRAEVYENLMRMLAEDNLRATDGKQTTRLDTRR